MKKIICRDCGQPFTTSGRSNCNNTICKACRARVANAKYKNIEYVRVLDLPEEEREKIFSIRERRNKNVKANKATKQKSEDISNSFNEMIKEDEKLVKEDINIAFRRQGVTLPSDFTSIVPLFNQLNHLFRNYEQYINNMRMSEEVLNKMSTDYSHAKEHYSSMLSKCNNKAEYEEIKNRKEVWERRHNILLEIRRKVKSVIMEYNNGGIFITKLLEDKGLIDEFFNYYDKLTGVSEIISSGSYKAEVSSLVESEDFCTGYKPNSKINKDKYNVTIKTRYLNNTSTFTRIVSADDEEDAKEQVINFIKSDPNKFKFTWKSNDVFVTKITGGCS